MRRAARLNCRLPEIGECCIGLRLDLRDLELMQEFSGGVGREAQVGIAEGLIDHGRAQKIAELLLFDGVTRRGQNVAAAGIDRTRDFSVEGRKKGEHAVFELEFGVAPPKLDAGTALDFVYSGRVSLNPVERGEDFARRRFLRNSTGRIRRRKNDQEEGPGFHAGSVVR
jgi:hypothetical protein